MGEVYRATDTQLNRPVALKLLPEAVSRDPERVARLRREAQTLAALNHPNVAQVYGLVDTGEALALAMELVDGEDLTAVLARGALPLDDALSVARQIAEALVAAHEQGIVHRDLKPANVKVRPDGTVKVLDFGLAKALEPGGVVSGEAVTLTSPAMTARGVILGTASYMAPEQARGKPVDRRADVWAFGVVLWEMLTGSRLFPGETVSDTLAAVLTREPDLDAVPARVRRLLAACLEKEPRKRLRDLGDAWLLLSGGEAAGTPARARPVLPWVLASLAAGALAALGLVALRARQAPPSPPTAFLEPPPAGAAFTSAPVPSPDGRALALLVRTSSGETRLFVRDVTEQAARPVEGSSGAEIVFWSPDGAQLAFVAGGEVRRAARNGGGATLVTATAASGGVWLPEGDLLLAVPGQGFLRVPASGGTPRRAAGFDEAAFRDQRFFDLAVSPDRRTLLYRQFGGETGIYAARLDGSLRRLVYPGEQSAAFFAGDGHVLRRRDNVLVAQAFDSLALAATGDAIPVAKDVDRYNYAASAGALCFVAGATEPTLLAWFDRTGKPQGTAAAEGQYSEVSISRRGRWLAFSRQDGGNVDVWVQSLLGGAPSRLTSDPDVDHLLTISDDERTLAWEAHAGGALNLMARPPDGTSPERLVRRWGKGGGPCAWTPDGRYVLYASEDTAGSSVFAVPADGSGEPVLLLPPATRAVSAQVSPDGRLLAYSGDATGRREVYLQPLDGVKAAGGAVRLSEEGGGWPLWRGDGREVYFLDRKNAVMAVEVDPASGRPAGAPRPLFTVAGLRSVGGWPYAITPDGQRVVAITASSASAPRAATVILGWRPGRQFRSPR